MREPIIGFPETMDVPVPSEKPRKIPPLKFVGYSFNGCGVFAVFRAADGVYRHRYSRRWTRSGVPPDPVRVFPNQADAVQAFRAERQLTQKEPRNVL